MSELKPLRDDLPEPVCALVEELRILFGGLGVSLRRYAATVPWDTAAVSRYLSGGRIPPWAFVHGLLVESTKKREDGAPPTPQVIGHLKRLHQGALESGGSPAHEVQLLEEKLTVAADEAERAAIREQALLTALQQAQWTRSGPCGCSAGWSRTPPRAWSTG